MNYLFIAINFWSTQTQGGSICEGPIYGSNDLFKKYSYLVGQCEIKRNCLKTTKDAGPRVWTPIALLRLHLD